jgi:diguanylate cyclase (GGDEF)-like protein
MRHSVDQFIDRSTPASRCLVPVLVATPVVFCYLVGHWLALRDPEIRLALRPGVVWALQAVLAAAAVVFIWAGIWLWPRRRFITPQPVASVAVALGVGLAYTAITIASGAFTAGPNLVMLGALANGLLLFDRRTMLIAFWACVSVLVGYDALVLAGQVPYAPAINELAFNGDQPQWWWALWRNAVFYTGLVAILVMLLVLFGRLDAVHQRLNRLSYSDGLTGLANRRHFMDRLAAEVRRQRRTHRPLSLVLIDADHFKQVNDNHGHPVGDEVLATLARLLSASVRGPADLVARLGGEEFALLLPDTTVAEAETVCQRVHSALARHDFQAHGQSFQVTVSMGLTQCHGQDADTALAQADRNLYRAKMAGRNQFISSVMGELAA